MVTTIAVLNIVIIYLYVLVFTIIIIIKFCSSNNLSIYLNNHVGILEYCLVGEAMNRGCFNLRLNVDRFRFRQQLKRSDFQT